MTTNEAQLLSSRRKLRKRLIQFLFLFLMTLLSCAGLVLIFNYAPWHLGEAGRDIGISMLIAGTVGLGVELSTRKEMERVLGDLIEEKLAEATSDRFAVLETALPRLDEIRDLVVRESGLQDAGVKRLSRRREDNLLQEFVERAAPGSTIRVMAICLNTLANNRGKDLFKRKLLEGCRIRLLLLDPDDSTALEERARQENRTSEEELRDFKERVQTWGSVHKNAIQKLAADKTLTGSIELGYYQSLPSCFLIDNGHAMLVGFYLHGCRGEKCPHLEIENRQNGFYLQFDQHFETLWARRITPFDRRRKEEPVEVERRGLRLA
ncbi:MAG: hypothetical protein ACJ76N_31165 [Thermoanaerobaculia bacterium]